MSNLFEERVRRYLEQFGDLYSQNESSGLYQPHPKPSPNPPKPNHASETLPQVGRDRHHPLGVEVRRDWVAISIPAFLSMLTVILLIATVIYTRRQWLETNRSANASEIAAHAAQSAAVTANSTLNEMTVDAQRTLDASKEAMKLDQRAWVGLSQFKAVRLDAEHIEQQGFATNSGKTPARKVYAVMGTYTRNSPHIPNDKDFEWIRYIINRAWHKDIKQTDYLWRGPVAVEPPYRGWLPPLAEDFSREREWVEVPQLKSLGVIPPGSSPYKLPLPFTTANLGRFTIIFYGEIKYIDFVGKEERSTQFCYFKPLFTVDFYPCDKLNDMY